MSNITSAQLRRALQIQERIEELQAELSTIIGETSSAESLKASRGFGSASHANLAQRADRSGHTSLTQGRRRSHPLKGKKRPSSPSGPLGPAVVAVLKKAGRPMRIGDILKGLAQSKYQWTCSDPKKNLYARIYRLKGVKRVSEGVFGLG